MGATSQLANRLTSAVESLRTSRVASVKLWLDRARCKTQSAPRSLLGVAKTRQSTHSL